jgi:hypothetical protein
MTDSVSTNFYNMGFNALSNSENDFNTENVSELTDPKFVLGDSVSLACTSTKILRSINGQTLDDITPTGGLLATHTAVAMSSNNSALVVGTNPAGATTFPILYSPNGINFKKSPTTTALAIAPTCVDWNPGNHVFVVGCTTINGNPDSAVLIVDQQGNVTQAEGASTAFTDVGSACRAVACSDKGLVTTGPGLTFLGGQLNGAGGNRVLAVGQNILGTAGEVIVFSSTSTGVGAAGSINAIATDNGSLNGVNYFILAGGAVTAVATAPATTSNLFYTSAVIGADIAGGAVWSTAIPTIDGIFPAGLAASRVDAIACNGQFFLVAGFGTVGPGAGVANTLTLVNVSLTIGTTAFTATAITSNIANLFTRVRSLEWNGLYWIAGGDNTSGFVYARSFDAVTWTLIGGAIAGATSGVSVSSRFK